MIHPTADVSPHAEIGYGTRIWHQAQVIKCNPDTAQISVRLRALQDGKRMYMAVPRLRELKCFIELDPSRLGKQITRASSIEGASRLGRPVLPNDIKPIDLIVCGSVAVNRQGARVGKGGGYSDLEFALLTEQRKIGPDTPIITSVHPLQIVDEEIPMTEHDIPLTAIVTPNEIVEITSPFPRPKGIYWEILPPEKIAAIPVLSNRKKTVG